MCVQYVTHRAEIDLNSRECPPNVLLFHQISGNHLDQDLCGRVLGVIEYPDTSFCLSYE